MGRYILLLIFLAGLCPAKAQTAAERRWVDSVYNSLTPEQRIAQLMVVRLSTIDLKTKQVTFFDRDVRDLVFRYNIGSVCVFQGAPETQATIFNQIQAIAKTPVLFCIDGEWGLGMRLLDSVQPLPRQMMLGATTDSALIYDYGKLVAAQCRRFGIQVDYAPVVDVNNNPDNPVINDRSFGEDKYKVASFGVAYMRGLQDNGVMACAKHFPGHGDVNTDSHLDLPVIRKSLQQLDSLELVPFRRLTAAGVGSVMVAHLFIPSIDATPNRATSLSPQNVTGLLRDSLGYGGLTFTDALEMQGVKKFFPNGAAAVQALVAGNDMLCLPEDVPGAIAAVKNAVASGVLTDSAIGVHCRRLLLAKYRYGLSAYRAVDTTHLSADLNKGIPEMRRRVAQAAITLVGKTNADFFPLRPGAAGRVCFVGLGVSAKNQLAGRLQDEFRADCFYIPANSAFDSAQLKSIRSYDHIVVGLHGLSRFPSNNFGLTGSEKQLLDSLAPAKNVCLLHFGNAYAVKNFCNAANLVVAYEDDSIVQDVAADMLEGKIPYRGVLPVSVCPQLPFGFGLHPLPAAEPSLFAVDSLHQLPVRTRAQIDSVMQDAIRQKATPGAVVLTLENGKIIYSKAFGSKTYGDDTPLSAHTVYDLASVTKVAATTLAVMKLFESGKLNVDKRLRTYLPETIGTDKANITLRQLLLHEAGLLPFIPFYKTTLDVDGKISARWYRPKAAPGFSTQVADGIFVRDDFRDSLYNMLLHSPRTKPGHYVYSDNDFIFLQKVVERLTGKTLEDYVTDVFYKPMQLITIGFHPLARLDKRNIAPTESETNFRAQLLQGYVHDQGAAMMGGSAGHAGLFSDAEDLAAIFEMLLDSGVYRGVRYLQPATVNYFTGYGSKTSHRGLGFDKPLMPLTGVDPYPASGVSAAAFGHTGFTGTAVWADPVSHIVFVFLSNRLYPDGQNTLQHLNIRGKIYSFINAAVAR